MLFKRSFRYGFKFFYRTKKSLVLTGKNNDLCFSGHYVPQLSQAIVRYNNATNDKTINLKGYMVMSTLLLKKHNISLSIFELSNYVYTLFAFQVGNALTDDYYDHLGVFQFMWSSGLISDETYKLLNELCDLESFIHASESCEKILDIANNELGDIDPYSIYTPSCTANSSLPHKLLKRLVSAMYVYISM